MRSPYSNLLRSGELQFHATIIHIMQNYSGHLCFIKIIRITDLLPAHVTYLLNQTIDPHFISAKRYIAVPISITSLILRKGA